VAPNVGRQLTDDRKWEFVDNENADVVISTIMESAIQSTPIGK